MSVEVVPGPVRVALVGAGSASRAYLRTLDSLVSVGAATSGPIFDRNPERRRALGARRPASLLVDNLDAVLSGDSHLVVITTPPDSHAELTQLALDAGKHVVVEKPLTDDPDQARGIVDRAQQSGRLLVVAPFVQLSPAFAALHGVCTGGLLGDIHSARAMYGNTGSTWASWYHRSGVGPLGDLAVYNIKSLAVLLGPVSAVRAWQTTSSMQRTLPDGQAPTDPDTVHVMLEHRAGATSTIMASHAVWAYRRPAIELYGTEGSANLLGDDWDPEGFEVYRGDWGHWRSYVSPDRTWNWTDGLRTAVHALRTSVTDGLSNELDLHLLDVVQAARRSTAADGQAHPVTSTFAPLHLPQPTSGVVHVHDHTRPVAEQ
jgi:predicted dehydrogenase